MSDQTNTTRLTPLDVIMPPTYIGVLLTFRTTQPTETIHDHLQHGIDRLIDHLPWLSGRVHRSTSPEGKPALELRHNTPGSPCPLVPKGVIPAPYMDTSARGMPPDAIPAEFLPVSTAITEETWASGAPVFAASLFGFSDGAGVGVCLCAQHNVVDVTGFGEVIRLLSHLLSGQPVADLGPEFDPRGRLSAALASHLDTLSGQSTASLFQAHPEYSSSPPALPAEFAPSTSRLLRLPVSTVAEAKDVVRGHMASEPSTNTVLCALIWSAITAVRMRRNPDLAGQTSKLVMAVDGRRRIGQDFSGTGHAYLSNVVLYALASLSTRDLASPDGAALAHICRAIAESQERIDANSVAEVYSLVEGVDNHATIFPGWDLFGSRDLTITSWAHLDMYGLDFGSGLGCPEHVRTPYCEADGVFLVLPRAGQGEVIDVMVMLRRDDMDALGETALGRHLVA